ncbi:MAG: VCBS repeat-containing protein [Flavobacteriales bacterium]|nr:VCBS repeat-containing protein [Flavobacteriales bacterium]
MRSCIAWNEGGGKFQVQDLPSLAQAGPLNGLAAFDVNNDGHLDLMGAGNQWGAEVERSGTMEARASYCWATVKEPSRRCPWWAVVSSPGAM